MHRALRTGGLALPERAAIKAFQGIATEFGAIGAKYCGGVM